MEPTGSNGGVVQISVANEEVPSVKNMIKALLWAIVVKKEVRKDEADCQQILCTYIKIVMKERKKIWKEWNWTAEKIRG